MKKNIRYSIIKSTVAVVTLVTILALGQSAAQAQLGGLLKKKPAAGGGGGAAVDKDAFGKSADDAAGSVLVARRTFTDAKAILADAVGLKINAFRDASEASRLKEGSTSSADKVTALNDSRKTTEEADKQLTAAMEKSTELSAESKVKFAEGAGKFIEGVLLEKEQIATIQKLVEQGKSLVQSASPRDKPKVLGLVKPVTSLASIVPGDVKEGTATLGAILKFAKNQKIPIPNSDKATAGLGELAVIE